MIEPGASSRGQEDGSQEEATFSAEQLAFIDRLIVARYAKQPDPPVSAVTTLDGLPASSSSSGSGESCFDLIVFLLASLGT